MCSTPRLSDFADYKAEHCGKGKTRTQRSQRNYNRCVDRPEQIPIGGSHIGFILSLIKLGLEEEKACAAEGGAGYEHDRGNTAIQRPAVTNVGVANYVTHPPIFWC